jgi:hypothetical protein
MPRPPVNFDKYLIDRLAQWAAITTQLIDTAGKMGTNVLPVLEHTLDKVKRDNPKILLLPRQLRVDKKEQKPRLLDSAGQPVVEPEKGNA